MALGCSKAHTPDATHFLYSTTACIILEAPSLSILLDAL